MSASFGETGDKDEEEEGVELTDFKTMQTTEVADNEYDEEEYTDAKAG